MPSPIDSQFLANLQIPSYVLILGFWHHNFIALLSSKVRRLNLNTNSYFNSITNHEKYQPILYSHILTLHPLKGSQLS